MLKRRWLAAFAAAIGMLATPAVANAGQSFTFLQSGFTQSIFGVSSTTMGGVAFAPNNDPWVDECFNDGGPLTRFDGSTTIIVNGTSIHPGSVSGSSAGCGLTNGLDGNLYTNTSAGVRRLDPSTGGPSGGPLGPRGNALRIHRRAISSTWAAQSEWAGRSSRSTRP
jgi:hypothetical protein